MKQKKKVLILGGGGFIGSHIAESLIGDYSIRIFDKKNFSHKNISFLKGDLDVIEGDFINIADVERALKEVDYIFHLVCSTIPSTSNVNCCYDIETNVIATLKLLDCLKNKPATRLVFISSGGTVYGNLAAVPIKEQENNYPLCSYGITKLMVEKYLHLYRHLYGIDYCIVRLSNPYGERQDWNNMQGLIATVLYNICKGKPIEIWGDGTIVRDYIYIKDAMKCLAKLLIYSGNARIFNVGSGRGYSINEIVKKIGVITEKSPRIVYKANRSCDVQTNILDSTLARQELGWEPETPLEKGIARVYRWLSEALTTHVV
jgi:UDP-glucose 4-epimerase